MHENSSTQIGGYQELFTKGYDIEKAQEIGIYIYILQIHLELQILKIILL